MLPNLSALKLGEGAASIDAPLPDDVVAEVLRHLPDTAKYLEIARYRLSFNHSVRRSPRGGIADFGLDFVFTPAGKKSANPSLSDLPVDVEKLKSSVNKAVNTKFGDRWSSIYVELVPEAMGVYDRRPGMHTGRYHLIIRLDTRGESVPATDPEPVLDELWQTIQPFIKLASMVQGDVLKLDRSVIVPAYNNSQEFPPRGGGPLKFFTEVVHMRPDPTFSMKVYWLSKADPEKYPGAPLDEEEGYYTAEEED